MAENEQSDGGGLRDTVVRYRNSLTERLLRLPEARVENLSLLLHELEEMKAAAAANPGTKKEGDMSMGAPPEEYVPTDEELIVSAIGDRVRSIAEAGPADEVARAAGGLGGIEYGRVFVSHVDVQGTGRILYASEPQTIRVDFPKAG